MNSQVSPTLVNATGWMTQSLRPKFCRLSAPSWSPSQSCCPKSSDRCSLPLWSEPTFTCHQWLTIVGWLSLNRNYPTSWAKLRSRLWLWACTYRHPLPAGAQLLLGTQCSIPHLTCRTFHTSRNQPVSHTRISPTEMRTNWPSCNAYPLQNEAQRDTMRYHQCS